MKTPLCDGGYALESPRSDDRDPLAAFRGPGAATELKAFAFGLTALAGAVLGTRLTWPLLERAPLFLVFGAVLASAYFGTEAAGLLVILLAMFGAAHVIPPGGPALIDNASIITFLVASVYFNRLIVRRNQAVAALRVSEEQFRSTWEHAAAGVAVLDHRGHVERLNPAMERILGYPADAWRGVPFGYFIHPDEGVDLRARISALMAGEAQHSEFDRELRRRDGSSIVARVTLSPIQGADGRRRGACLTCEDVTGLRQAESALRMCEQGFRELFEDVPVALFHWAPDGAILTGNPALQSLLNYDSLPGMTLRQLCADERAASDLRSLQGSRSTEILTTRTRLRCSDGRTLTVILGMRAVLSAHGGVGYYEGMVLDIVDPIEAPFPSTHEKESLGLLVSGAVHNFRNLLTSIGGYGELMVSRLDAQREDLDQIFKATRRAADLTKQIMAFGRLDAAEERVVNVNAIIDGVGGALSRLIGDQIELSYVLEPHLRPVQADPNQVEQVLMNLSLNARDAMPRGGRLVFETTNVTVGAESYVRLVVRDTGSGMDDYVRSQLFKPFFTTKSPDAGTGLGLFTVDSIVKRMGGVIHVESEPNHGTTFMIDLPSSETCAQPVA